MKFKELEAALRKRKEGCPSSLEVDRLVAGELAPDAALDVEARSERFPECVAEISARQNQQEQTEERAGLLERIKRRFRTEPQPVSLPRTDGKKPHSRQG